MDDEDYQNCLSYMKNGYSTYSDFTDDPWFQNTLPEIQKRNPELFQAYQTYITQKKTLMILLKGICSEF